MVKKIIIDTDPGIDDSLAIFYALNSPELEILGLTTIFGNAHTSTCTINALKLLEVADAIQIPVYEGASVPLNGKFRGPASFVHGDDGQGNSFQEKPKKKQETLSAVEFLKKTINENPGEITLVPIGPLTNIAQLLTENLGIDAKIKEIVLMGGNAVSEGNATPTAEANILNDPEAADIVFSAKCLVTMVGLDVTNKVFMQRDEIETLYSFDNPKSKHLEKITPFYHNFLKVFFDKDGIPIHDSTAITYLLKPEFFTVIKHPIKVETEGFSRGKTWMAFGSSNIEDWQSERLKPWAGRNKINICIDVDHQKVIDFIIERNSY